MGQKAVVRVSWLFLSSINGLLCRPAEEQLLRLCSPVDFYTKEADGESWKSKFVKMNSTFWITLIHSPSKKSFQPVEYSGNPLINVAKEHVALENLLLVQWWRI